MNIRVGDKIVIAIPNSGLSLHILPPGIHNTRVTAVRTPTDKWTARLTLSMLDDPAKPHIVSVPVFIPSDLRQDGYLYLSNEQWPVSYKHEPDLLKRLSFSVSRLTRRKKRPCPLFPQVRSTR